MYCVKCGSYSDDGKSFCSTCGSAFDFGSGSGGNQMPGVYSAPQASSSTNSSPTRYQAAAVSLAEPVVKAGPEKIFGLLLIILALPVVAFGFMGLAMIGSPLPSVLSILLFCAGFLALNFFVIATTLAFRKA